MKNNLYILNTTNINNLAESLTSELESGKVLFLPKLTFTLNDKDKNFLKDSILSSKHKNISYNLSKQKISGISKENQHLSPELLDFMHRFSLYAQKTLLSLCPQYKDHIKIGRTSYRPAQIKTRIRSKRQDDTRLHVDSFATTPVNGERILRVFCNINPKNEPRVWNLGEPFEVVLNKFKPLLPKYNPLYAKFLQTFKLTKSLRTEYDHIMLNLHDNMKLDENYQQNVAKTQIEFPPQSTWIVYTDQVSHAGLSGQYLLEQTFYLPSNAMQHPKYAPINIIQNALKQT